MAIPESEGEGFIKETMYVEYEWSPHRCATCCVFGHNIDACPKQPMKPIKALHEEHKRNVQKNRSTKKMHVVDQDGYTEVHGKKAAKKVGIPVNKQKSRFEYRPVGPKPKGDSNKASSSNSNRSNNPFDILNEVDADSGATIKNSGMDNEDTDDDVEEVYNETDGFMMEGTLNIKSKGASTPSPIVNNESHVDVGNMGKVCNSVFRSWDWSSNGGCCDKGTRIIIGWNPAIFDVMILSQSPQVMHIQLVFKIDKRMVFCSFVYADNYYVSRKELWHNLSLHKVLVGNKPWCIMGDFNTALNIEDNSMGSSSVSIGMRDFQECVDDIEVVDINRMGIHYTWSQKPKNGVGLMKKIDRVMGNTPFVAEYPNSVAFFKPYRLSDHCPCLLSFPEAGIVKPRSFKFANFSVFKPEFLGIVKNVWDSTVSGNLHKKVEALQSKLDDIQQSVDQDPNNVDLRVAEKETSRDLLEASLDEERFLKQKSKVDWLRVGDTNSAFFHSSLKIRNHCSRIDVIKDSDGNLYEGDAVFQAFVNHYQKFFGNLLWELNHTTIVLIPKVPTPATVIDYRPIACCNVLYKCISKIVADRIKGVLNDIVSINQSAFVPGRRISDNIILTQELMHNYHRSTGPPRCAFKVDIQKAYDTVDWRFLKSVLLGFGFHGKMVDWIMVLVSTASFSICVNGSMHGFFKGSRGLRQGDPISPYLFTLVMEVLTAILQHAVRIDSSFKFHNKCERQQIINLCFADDLFIFARGEVNLARCILTSLSNFTKMSGGLGIRRIGDMNKALMPSHIWSIVSKRDSLWVQWVHSYHLKGNGARTSAWFDFWCDPGPLSDFLSPRTITDADFKLDDSVANVYSSDSWRWPTAWRDLFPVLIHLDQMHLIPTKQDRLFWKDGNDLTEFSSSNVWHSVRYKEPEVNWCNIVWFSQCIPRHAFMMWLVMKVRQKVGMSSVTPKWRDIVDWLLARARSKSVAVYVAKLLMAAASYFIWQERNNRYSKTS
ncbi:uncharacterized protein LOC110942480 [Helianthus annuus]|uniref:uncharacterized protein LOC110942480 n=1 Tax=Helianthus annuus TaxID=4232 RepID=UPI000B8F46FB|nr:uncharacterized protein LOC110942480 [Helianthus annuus]